MAKGYTGQEYWRATLHAGVCKLFILRALCGKRLGDYVTTLETTGIKTSG
jgi:hypothetical protein